MTTSDKADRAHLPPPTTRRSGPASEHVDPATDLERRLAEALAEALHVDRVSVTADIFDGLGATSLLVARFTARLRGHDDTASVSIKDVYQHRSVRELATALAALAPGDDAVEDPAPRADPVVRTSTTAYVVTGCVHLLLVLLGSSVGGVILVIAYNWVTAATTVVGLSERATGFVAGLFVALSVLPVAAKWLLIGRWTPREIPLWGPGHLRFWVVRILVGLSPLVLFVGTPLFTLYLRALGAHIGRDVLVLTRSVPVAADLVTLGAGTVVRRDASFNGYRALPGRLQVGPVTLGSNVLVGERAVLDIDVEMGDDSQIAPSSSLSSGTVVPAGESWEGSPAGRTDTDRRTVPVAPRRPVRRWLFALGLALLTVVVGAAVFTVLTWALSRLPGWMPSLAPALARASSTTSSWAELVVVVLAVLALAIVLFPLGVLVMVAVPRVLAPFVRPHRVYPLHGVAHFVQLLISGVTNSQFFMLMLGDSSFVTTYLRVLGLRLRPVQQTGSNFGTQLMQDSPLMIRVGTGTMISDGLTIANAEWSSTSFTVSPVHVGARNFLGNNIVFPPGARVGDNVLLATKALLPVDGPVREDVGLLGSPPFEIPRGRPRDERFAFLDDPDEVRRRLPAKNRHNALSIVTVLLARALQAAITTAAAGVGLVALLRYGAAVALAAGLPSGVVTTLTRNGAAVGLAVGLPVALVVAVLLSLLFERAASALGGIRPHQGSIYERRFWRHERLWKLYVNPIMPGSPVQNVLSRVAGLRVGRRVFDDGCGMPEKALVAIGDDVVLNAGAVVQCHSLEDGLITRDVTEVGSGSCLGVGAFVHLGVTVGDGTMLEADSFLMKGEQTAVGSTWGGNPAAPLRTASRGSVQ